MKRCEIARKNKKKQEKFTKMAGSAVCILFVFRADTDSGSDRDSSNPFWKTFSMYGNLF